MKISRLLAATLFVAAPGLVLAQGVPQGMTYEQFDYIDKDKNGAISDGEYFEFMEGAFKELDSDKNNSLSRDETAKVLTTAQFSEVDANGNGRISRQEFLDHVMSDFRRHDSDGNGQLTP